MRSLFQWDLILFSWLMVGQFCLVRKASLVWAELLSWTYFRLHRVIGLIFRFMLIWYSPDDLQALIALGTEKEADSCMLDSLCVFLVGIGHCYSTLRCTLLLGISYSMPDGQIINACIELLETYNFYDLMRLINVAVVLSNNVAKSTRKLNFETHLKNIIFNGTGLLVLVKLVCFCFCCCCVPKKFLIRICVFWCQRPEPARRSLTETVVKVSKFNRGVDVCAVVVVVAVVDVCVVVVVVAAVVVVVVG